MGQTDVKLAIWKYMALGPIYYVPDSLIEQHHLLISSFYNLVTILEKPGVYIVSLI